MTDQATIQKTADNLVRSEILLCVSALVHDAMRSNWTTDDHGEDELIGLWSGPVDYREAALWHIGEDLEEADLLDECEARGLPTTFRADDGELCVDAARTALRADLQDCEGWADFCHEYDVDIHDYQREVFEHWAVAPMMANSLEEVGETVVRDWHGLTIWARTTTGQAISMDACILEVARRLNDKVSAS